MTEFKKGQLVKSKNSNYYTLIIAVVDDLFFLSQRWRRDEYAQSYSNGMRADQQSGATYTRQEVGSYFVPATEEEAGMPVKAWRPTLGEPYFYAWISIGGMVNVETKHCPRLAFDLSRHQKRMPGLSRLARG